jgi:hypothetical protein
MARKRKPAKPVAHIGRVSVTADVPKADTAHGAAAAEGIAMIRKLKSGHYRLYSRKRDPKTGRRRNLGTFKTRAEAQKHERAVQYFKRAG